MEETQPITIEEAKERYKKEYREENQKLKNNTINRINYGIIKKMYLMKSDRYVVASVLFDDIWNPVGKSIIKMYEEKGIYLSTETRVAPKGDKNLLYIDFYASLNPKFSQDNISTRAKKKRIRKNIITWSLVGLSIVAITILLIAF